MIRILHSIASLSAVALMLALAPSASADQRRFTYVYETITAPKGSFEVENYVTWSHRATKLEGFNVWDFRHELEIGLTDRLQLSLYIADWSYTDPENRGRYENSGIELIYNLTNPNTNFLGSALYFEALAGSHSLEIEGKLLLQKNLGPVIMAYNIALEAEWEGERFGHFDEQEGEFSQSLGVSYEVSKNFSVGAEVLHEIDMPRWSEAEDSNVFAGPNVSFRFGRMFATVTGLFQLTNNKSEPDVQTRLIVGFQF